MQGVVLERHPAKDSSQNETSNTSEPLLAGRELNEFTRTRRQLRMPRSIEFHSEQAKIPDQYRTYERSHVRFTLGLNEDSFTSEVQNDFLDTISILAGVPQGSIIIRSVQVGCIKITLELDAEALVKLLQAIDPSPHNLQPLAADQKIALGRLWDEFALQFAHKLQSAPNELAQISKSDQPDIILFIHGWLGGEKTFGKLPGFLEDATGCPCKIFTYPTGFFEKSSSIAFLARAFDNWVRNELHGTDANVAIIAHSMGGVVVRDFLGSQRLSSRPICPRVRHISFMASPQAGVWLAKVAKRIPTSATAQAADLSPNSPYLTQVNSAWNSWFPKQEHLVGNVRSFFATNDQIVDYASAIGSDPESIPVLDADHFSIVKPQRPADDVVRTLIRIMDDSGISNN